MSGDPQHCIVQYLHTGVVLLCRASLICGKLPAEEMRDLRSKLTKQMDVLNHMLELDLVVRYGTSSCSVGGSVSDADSLSPDPEF